MASVGAETWRRNSSIAGDARDVGSSAVCRPLRILYSHRTQSRDGQFVHIQELICALRALGHVVDIVEPRHVKSLRLGDEPRLTRNIKKYIPRFAYELMELAYNIPEFLSLVVACRTRRPDVLYQRANLYMVSGLLCARLFDLPYLLEVNAPLTEERRRFGNLRLAALAGRMERAVWRAADHVLPVTHVLGRKIIHAGVLPQRITVVPNGVDLEKFTVRAQSSLRRSLSLDGKLVLGFVGFVREWHHADAIVELLSGSDLPANAHFLIVGDGPVTSALLDQARRQGVGDRLTITGIVPREDIAQFIDCFDVAVQPHVVAYASPLKLLEYMALGRAIVAPATENIRELLVHEGNALLIEPEDRRALAAAIIRLANNGELRQKLGRAARETVLSQDLTWLRNARVVTALAQASLGDRASGQHQR
jgi:glycosyltransferase involved in cell wall biosynthesis